MIAEPRASRLPYKGGFPVYPSRYVVLGAAERRAALRFFNASDVGVTGIRFRLSEKDEGGNLLGERTVERDGLAAEPGEEFAVADVPVDYECAAVEICVLAVFSDGYEYIFGDDGVTLRYGHEKKIDEPQVKFVPRATYSVSGRRKKFILLAVLAVLGFAAAAGAIAWRFGLFDRAERAAVPQDNVQIVRSVADVEA